MPDTCVIAFHSFRPVILPVPVVEKSNMCMVLGRDKVDIAAPNFAYGMDTYVPFLSLSAILSSV